jgi:hypothetical protein
MNSTVKQARQNPWTAQSKDLSKADPVRNLNLPQEDQQTKDYCIEWAMPTAQIRNDTAVIKRNFSHERKEGKAKYYCEWD